jgi:uncharacterized protein
VITDRLEGWIHVGGGRRFWPLEPRAEDIHLDDVIHALSNLCRYGGHTREFYSVAQHTVYVAHRTPQPLRKWALVHDFSEAYLVDMPRPIKHQPEFEFYNVAEGRIQRAVFERFGLRGDLPAEVKQIDADICYDEMHDMLADSEGHYVPMRERKLVKYGWPPDHARIELARLCRNYGVV